MINIGIGIGWAKALYSVANNVIANFKARVLSYPNSIFEAGACLDATLEGLNAKGLLDNASLIITPNAYNEGKLYDVVPNTTLGDMNVVRATTATRVNEQGLIEVVPRNLLTYSNTFTNGIWTQQAGTSIIPNNAISPDGLMNATKVISNGNNGIYQAPITVSTTVNNTKSIYLKGAIGGETVLLLDPWQSINTTSCVLTTEWQRFTLSETQSGGDAGLWVKNVPSTGIYIYGAQLEAGSTATEYFPTTTRLNIPRIDYTNGSCPSLLVEPMRTNLLTYSEQLDNIAWFKNNVTVTANSIISPSGTLTADTITIPSAGYGIFQVVNVSPSSTYTFSFYAKKGTNTSYILDVIDGSTFTSFTTVDYSSQLNSNWVRVSATFTTASTTTSVRAYLMRDGSSVGNGYFWGAQLEAGSYATSYIPTVATSVTRNADVISKTGISSLIGQTEGTIFFDGIVNNIQNFATNILNTNKDPLTISTFALGKINASNKFSFDFFLGTGTFAAINLLSSGTFANGTRTKVAIRYKSGDFAMYVNGTLQATSTSTYTANGSKSEIFLNDPTTYFFYQENVAYNSAQLYKTGLSNSELAQLTTI